MEQLPLISVELSRVFCWVIAGGFGLWTLNVIHHQRKKKQRQEKGEE